MTILNSDCRSDFAGTAANNRTYAIPYAVPVGQVLVVGVVVNAAVTTSSMTDAQGNSYQRYFMLADPSNNHTLMAFGTKVTTARPANATVTLTLNTTKTRWSWTSTTFDDVTSATPVVAAVTNNGNASTPTAWSVGPTANIPASIWISRICWFGSTDISGNISMNTVDLLCQSKTTAGASSDRESAIGAGYISPQASPFQASSTGNRDAQAVWEAGLVILPVTPIVTGPQVSVWDGAAEHPATVSTWDGSAEHAGTISIA